MNGCTKMYEKAVFTMHCSLTKVFVGLNKGLLALLHDVNLIHLTRVDLDVETLEPSHVPTLCHSIMEGRNYRALCLSRDGGARGDDVEAARALNAGDVGETCRLADGHCIRGPGCAEV